VSGKVAVADREFGREAILLDKDLYALVRRSRDIARDSRAIRRVLTNETKERLWKGPWRAPIAKAKGSGYGIERFYYPTSEKSQTIKLDPELKTTASFGADTLGMEAKVPSWRHAGIDIPASKGAAVNAPQHGVVAEVGDYTLSGRTLLVDHGQGVYTAFFHLDTVLVKKGDAITMGQRIARVGSTGLATGPHLHYGTYLHGKDVDPSSWESLPSFVTAASSADTSARRRKP
jgi:murein DD-endopeptidase MepM/ murein hydrolase activator NlpD